MSLTINAKAYAADTYSGTAVIYNGPVNTLTTKDLFRLTKSAPKPTAVFSGVSRTTAKFTRTLPLTGALTPTGEMIVEISVSTPVGAASADIDAAMNDSGSWQSSASAKSHVKVPQISF